MICAYIRCKTTRYASILYFTNSGDIAQICKPVSCSDFCIISLSSHLGWRYLIFYHTYDTCIWREMPVSNELSHVRGLYILCRCKTREIRVLFWYNLVAVSHVFKLINIKHLTCYNTSDKCISRGNNTSATCVSRGIPREMPAFHALDMHLTCQLCISRVSPASDACMGGIWRVKFLE